MGDLQVEWLGEVPYAHALRLQEQAVSARLAGRTRDRLLLLEHPAVVTLGRSARPENLLAGEDELRARGIEVHAVARGGDVTYHAPGQLVGYLIVDLSERGARDVHVFLRDVEGALIQALGGLGVPGRRSPGRTGVFVGPDRKIASIGVGLRRWVSWHGFALNVSLDLEGFGWIVPCGLHDVRMTSVAAEAGATAGLDARVRKAVAAAFRDVFRGRRAPCASSSV